MSQELWANQAGSYSAELTRRAIFAQYARTGTNSPGIIAGGLVGPSDLQLSAPASGMSVNVSTGEAIIGGTEGAAQGGYYGRNTAQQNISVSASNPSNPRVDTVVATVADAGYTQPSDVGGTTNGLVLAVVAGTPTAGANLTNLSGAAAVPLSSLVLGYVLVPLNSTNVTAGNISNVAVIVRGGAADTNQAFALYGTVTERSGQTNAFGAATYILVGPGVIPQTSVSNGAGLGAFYFDPADWTTASRTTKMRIRAMLLTNGTTPTGVTYTIGLYPITGSGGGAGANTVTLGTVQAGSTASFGPSPALNAMFQSGSGDFTIPSAGWYVLGLALSNAEPANAAVVARAWLQVRET